MTTAELELYAALSRAMHEAHVVSGLSVAATVAVSLTVAADLTAAELRLSEAQAARMAQAPGIVGDVLTAEAA